MKKKKKNIVSINTLSEFHKVLEVRPPTNPLISVIDFKETFENASYIEDLITYKFYCISFIKNERYGHLYGRQAIDFDNGVLKFCSPKQLLEVKDEHAIIENGKVLVVHPDFLQGYELAKKIKEYGFFSYSITEALHLSDQESKAITTLFDNIQNEISRDIDSYSQDIIVSYFELLLNYSNRFYNRQFITRKVQRTDLLEKINAVLADYFDSEHLAHSGIPTVQWLAEQFNLSPNYLSDMLRSNTGLTAKQHIQNQLLEKAKEILATSNKTVSEIAYSLGFGYPQSFNKFFKNQTHKSPIEFRKSLN